MTKTVRVIAARSFRYGTRRMEAGTEIEMPPGHARVLTATGRVKPIELRPVGTLPPPTGQPLVTALASGANELAAARQAYQAKMGKRPYPGWDVAELARRMADGDASLADATTEPAGADSAS